MNNQKIFFVVAVLLFVSNVAMAVKPTFEVKEKPEVLVVSIDYTLLSGYIFYRT